MQILILLGYSKFLIGVNLPDIYYIISNLSDRSYDTQKNCSKLSAFNAHNIESLNTKSK